MAASIFFGSIIRSFSGSLVRDVGPVHALCLFAACSNRARREPVRGDHAVAFVVHLSECQHAGGAALDAGRTADAFRVRHRQTFVRKVHDINSLVANGSTNHRRFRSPNAGGDRAEPLGVTGRPAGMEPVWVSSYGTSHFTFLAGACPRSASGVSPHGPSFVRTFAKRL